MFELRCCVLVCRVLFLFGRWLYVCITHFKKLFLCLFACFLQIVPRYFLILHSVVSSFWGIALYKSYYHDDYDDDNDGYYHFVIELVLKSFERVIRLEVLQYSWQVRIQALFNCLSQRGSSSQEGTVPSPALYQELYLINFCLYGSFNFIFPGCLFTQRATYSVNGESNFYL